MKYWHLTLATILLISLPAIAVTNHLIVDRAGDQFTEANRELMVSIADDLEGSVDSHLGDRRALIGTMATVPGMAEDCQAVVDDFYGGDPADAEGERLSKLLDTLLYGTNEGATILLLDTEFGAIVFSSSSQSPLEGYIPLNGSQLSSAVDGPQVTYLPTLPWGAVSALLISEPVKDVRGGTIAVLVALVRGEELEPLLVIHEDMGPGGGAYLVGPDGRLLTRSPGGDGPGMLANSKGASKALGGSSGFHVIEGSEEELEAYKHVPGWDLALVVTMDAEVAGQAVSDVEVSAIAAGIIVSVALLFISVIISKNLVRDLGSLVEWSKDVGNGEWDAPLELGPTDEFQELEGAFKRMVRDMVKHQSQLRMVERRFSNLFSNSLDPVYIARSDGRIMELNPAGAVILGLPRQTDGTYGYSLEELFADDDARRELIGRLERDGAVAGFEAQLRLPSGRELFVLISSTRRMDEQGRTLAYQGVIHDITDRKRFEDAIVEAKNEAEFYCDIMSHDLNNAVQGLGGYLELCTMATDLDDVNRFLPYAHDQMARASDLLRNVRRLSHLGTQDVELKAMDLRKTLVKSIWAVERGHSHETIDIRFDHPDDSSLVKGEAFIEDVFINLLDNAIKYDTHETKVVDIEVMKVDVEGTQSWRVMVADRGPGVADRDKQTIFGRFERRSLKEYGTGLGLSIVVKAVERSGGRTWVEDRVPGDHTQGAVFVVELLAA